MEDSRACLLQPWLLAHVRLELSNTGFFDFPSHTRTKWDQSFFQIHEDLRAFDTHRMGGVLSLTYINLIYCLWGPVHFRWGVRAPLPRDTLWCVCVCVCVCPVCVCVRVCVCVSKRRRKRRLFLFHVSKRERVRARAREWESENERGREAGRKEVRPNFIYFQNSYEYFGG